MAENQHEEQPTKVIFRKFRSNGDIVAVFPEDPWSLTGYDVSCFDPHGGHCAGNWFAILAQTVPAKPDEYAACKRTLELNYGYKLVLRRRYSRSMSEKMQHNQAEARKAR